MSGLIVAVVSGQIILSSILSSFVNDFESIRKQLNRLFSFDGVPQQRFFLSLDKCQMIRDREVNEACVKYEVCQ